MRNCTIPLTLLITLNIFSSVSHGRFDLRDGIYIKISPPPQPPPLPIPTPQIVKDVGNILSNGSKQIVNGAVSTISQTLDHNSKTIRDVGRISASVFTAGISEVYIRNKKKEAIKEQEKIRVVAALQTSHLEKVNADLVEIFKLKQAELQVKQSEILAGVIVNLQTEPLMQWIALINQRLIYLQNEALSSEAKIANTTDKIKGI